MSAEAADAPHAPAKTNSALLRIAGGPLVAPVLTRVVAMMLARADCPVDRLDDAMLICDALSAHAPALAADGNLAVTILTDGGGMTLRIGALRPGGGERLRRASTLPGVGSVLESIADELRVEASAEDGEELILDLHFAAAEGDRQPAGSPESR